MDGVSDICDVVMLGFHFFLVLHEVHLCPYFRQFFTDYDKQ